MNIPPLAIVQARIGSTRLPGKMLLPIGGKPLVWCAWNAAVEAFGRENVVCAIPATVENDPLADTLRGFGAEVFRWAGPENDVLGRFVACAHRYRWHPDTVLIRVTPDDWRKDPRMLRRVANGERLPVELGGEAFTLRMLDEAHRLYGVPETRQHLTYTLFAHPAPPPPDSLLPWSIDTREDYEAACGLLITAPGTFDAKT